MGPLIEWNPGVGQSRVLWGRGSCCGAKGGAVGCPIDGAIEWNPGVGAEWDAVGGLMEGAI